MRDALTALALMTGGLIWAVILSGLLFWVLFFGLPAMFRWLCYVGYSAFADRAEKDERRAIAKRRAALP